MNTKKTLMMLGGLMMLLTSQQVFAGQEGARTPLERSWPRSRTIEVDRYGELVSIERPRTTGKKQAVFYAEPQLIESGAVIVFEIRSQSDKHNIPRWRCVAVHDVADCLGTKVKIRYLPGDQKLVLTVVAKIDKPTPLAVASR